MFVRPRRGLLRSNETAALVTQEGRLILSLLLVPESEAC